MYHGAARSMAVLVVWTDLSSGETNRLSGRKSCSAAKLKKTDHVGDNN
jgi:hypothetical protein